jgi:hypothetical protein
MLTPKVEQIFYAMFLIMIAAFYLAFAAYFGVATTWRLETDVIVAFVAISLLGARFPLALIIGYPARAVGPAARTSGAWSLLRIRAGAADRNPAWLRSILCSLRLLHGGIFLCATRRVDCRVEGGFPMSCHGLNVFHCHSAPRR